jgi:hypothetical protein
MAFYWARRTANLLGFMQRVHAAARLAVHPIFLFFKPWHEAKISMKSSPRGRAIKNSADEDPEGYSTILDAPMCNGGLVLSFEPFLSGQMSTR